MDRDVVELIDRQFQQLLALDGAPFVRQLRRTLELVEAEPRCKIHLDDLRRDAGCLVSGLWLADQSQVDKLVALRRRIPVLVPAADDSAAQPPDSERVPSGEWGRTLAYFDTVLRTTRRDPPATFDYYDESVAGRLLPILDQKLNHTDFSAVPPVDVAAVRQAMAEVEQQHQRTHARFIDDKLTFGAVALIELGNFVFDALDPLGWELVFVPDDQQPEAASVFSIRLPSGGREYDLHDRNSLAGGEGSAAVRALAADVARAKARVRQLYEELRGRLGSRQSLLGLVERFRHRCQWHDRDRLRLLAASAKGRAEEVLTGEFARWLFDNGLSPVSKPTMGGLIPDLTDPSFKFNLYVEAKQYDKAAKGYLIKGFHQLWDTVAGLQGTPYAVHEAFYVVFRLGGPRYVLPESIRGEGWTAHLRLIDTAPIAQKGSKGAQKPVVISAAELTPASLAATATGGSGPKTSSP